MLEQFSTARCFAAFAKFALQTWKFPKHFKLLLRSLHVVLFSASYFRVQFFPNFWPLSYTSWRKILLRLFAYFTAFS